MENSTVTTSARLELSALQVWWLAIRPKTLWAGAIPVVVGTAIAYGNGAAHWLSATLALVGALSIQIGTNLNNDYADFEKGADTSERKGPTRVTQSGLLSSRAVMIGTVFAFAAAILSGSYLILRGGWPILAIGATSIISGILYTSGPKPLGYLGLGDLFVLVFFGPVAVAGTQYVQELTFSWIALLAGLGPGLLSVALLSVNNLRDINEDRKAGKRTLAVRFGERFTRWEYRLCVFGAGLVPIAISILTGKHWVTILAAVALISAAPAFRALKMGVRGEELNALIGLTGRLSIIYALILSLTWSI